MTGNEPSAVARDVETLFRFGAAGGLTDGQLLERFATRRDAGADAAFAALVQRHGPMVWGVCRRALDDPHAAADAFQATFLVLVRKAGSIRVDDSLGRWLYGVSRRVAIRARRTAARRASRETAGVEALAAPDPAPDHSEWLAELDREIARLPERYRAAVVLCDLGGTTHEEAARQLGCAVGTVGSRLSRGRERLRERLTRRGLAPVAAAAGAGLASKSATASVPPALVHATTLSALRLPAGASLITAHATTLAKGTLNAMLWNRLGTAAAALALLGTAALALSTFAASPRPQAPPEAHRDAAPIPPAADSPDQILARSIKTYAEARSYEDAGLVTQVYLTGKSRRTLKRPFSTRFTRPNLFFYEFSERSGDGDDDRNRYVIWADEAPERSRCWWTLRPEIKQDTLAMTIAGGTGISGGSAFLVPQMLMPVALPSLPLSGLAHCTLAGEESVDDFPCHKLVGTAHSGNPMTISGNPMTIWIDKETSLLRKVFTTSQIPGSTVEQTTTYRPRLNPDIPAERFTFDPPKP